MNKVVKIEKILIDKDKIPKIMKIFGCGKATVYNALAYRSNSQPGSGHSFLCSESLRSRICKGATTSECVNV